MATAAQVIKAALQRIIVQASEQPIRQDEANDAIFAMNNLMLGYDAMGIELGYTEVASLGDEITIPAGALRGLIANLAIEIAPDYGGEVSAALANAAREGKLEMMQIGVATPSSYYPSTLPTGTGNIDDATYNNRRFYPDLEAEILAETTGAIALEANTNKAAGD